MKNGLSPLAILASHCPAARRVCVKGNILRMIAFGTGAGFLDWAGVGTGCARPHGIRSGIDCRSRSGRICGASGHSSANPRTQSNFVSGEPCMSVTNLMSFVNTVPQYLAERIPLLYI